MNPFEPDSAMTILAQDSFGVEHRSCHAVVPMCLRVRSRSARGPALRCYARTERLN